MSVSRAPIPIFRFIQKLKLLHIGISKWDIPTYTTSEELLKLYDLAKTLPKESIALEIGSYIGASTLLIAKGLRKKSIVIGITPKFIKDVST